MNQKKGAIKMKRATKIKAIEVKERFKKKWVIIGLAGLIYNVLEQSGIKIPNETFKLMVDIASYIVMGYAVYTNHDESENGVI